MLRREENREGRQRQRAHHHARQCTGRCRLDRRNAAGPEARLTTRTAGTDEYLPRSTSLPSMSVALMPSNTAACRPAAPPLSLSEGPARATRLAPNRPAAAARRAGRLHKQHLRGPVSGRATQRAGRPSPGHCRHAHPSHAPARPHGRGRESQRRTQAREGRRGEQGPHAARS